MARNMRVWLAALGLACVAGSAAAEGSIGTLPRGTFACELPGDAGGQASIPQPEAGFTIESASRYSTPGGGGTYLRRGDKLMMTSGPHQGESYELRSDGYLRRMEHGRPGRLRCVRSQH
jgi:hypothetical protein